MFETTSHDFGTVARGERAEFEFVLETIHIETSLGAVTPVTVYANIVAH